jgi:ABC-type sugar transport system ATPase subunit
MKRADLELRRVSKRYNAQLALEDVSLRVEPGDHTAIVGSSGCGKSTLLRMVAGLEAPSSGEVLLGGEVVSDTQRIVLPPHRRGIAMVFQDLALWPNLSVLENVMLGLGGTECSKAERAVRAADALTICGIPDLADRKPGTSRAGSNNAPPWRGPRRSAGVSVSGRTVCRFDPVIKAKLFSGLLRL